MSIEDNLDKLQNNIVGTNAHLKGINHQLSSLITAVSVVVACAIFTTVIMAFALAASLMPASPAPTNATYTCYCPPTFTPGNTLTIR